MTIYTVEAKNIWNDTYLLDIVSYHKSKELAEKKLEEIKKIFKEKTYNEYNEPNYIWDTTRSYISTIEVEE